MGQADRQVDGGTGRQAGRWMVGQAGRQVDGGTGRQAGRQVDGGTGRWRVGGTGRPVEVGQIGNCMMGQASGQLGGYDR